MSSVIKPLETPFRTPKQVEHLVAEPGFARAGTSGRWKLNFVLSREVPPGHRFFLQIHGKRNNGNRWAGLQVEDENAEGYLSLSTNTHGPLRPLAVTENHGLFEFELPPDGLAQGERITAKIGGAKGAMAPLLATSSKFFLLLDVPPEDYPRISVLNTETAERIVGVCGIVFAGGDAVRLCAHAPSTVAVGEPVSILVRPEDIQGNVASSVPGALTVRLDGRELQTEATSVDGSSCRRIKGITLARPGTYRLEIEDTSRDLKTLTNPIVCTAEPPEMRLMWGMIHGHTEMSDGFGTLDHYFRYMRDECALDFGATGDHDHVYETSEDMWEESQDAVVRYNQPGRFTTFLGYEWAKWRRNGEGDRNVYYLHDHRPMYRSDEGHSPTPPDLFASLRDETAIVIPHHTANPRSFVDWKDHDPSKERLVEIFSIWGNSERGAVDGNPYPIQAPHGDDPAGEYAPGFVQTGLKMGWRVGFTAGGDDHRAHPGDNLNPEPDRPDQYRAGLFAVYVKDNTRESIWDALWNRRCVATTGARIFVDFRLNSYPMGSELRQADAQQRRITVRVHGTGKIKSVEIVRNNEDVHTVHPDSEDVQLEWTDGMPLSEVCLPPAQHCPAPFAFYYVRVTQADGEIAWASPVWIS